jgi:hypothetical protein
MTRRIPGLSDVGESAGGRVNLGVRFFLAWWRGVFAGGFANSCAQNVVKCVVNRGGFVVKVWSETIANPSMKMMPTFAYFFQIFATINV